MKKKEKSKQSGQKQENASASFSLLSLLFMFSPLKFISLSNASLSLQKAKPITPISIPISALFYTTRDKRETKREIP